MTVIADTINEIAKAIAYLSRRVRDLEVQPKFASSDLTNYFSSSTIVGWASFTESQIAYKKINDTVYVSVCLDGTSDNAALTFTLPYTSVSDYRWIGPIAAVNAGAAVDGAIFVLGASSATVTCYTTVLGATWSNSARKAVFFQFRYDAA